jgi:hypothetical protein
VVRERRLRHNVSLLYQQPKLTTDIDPRQYIMNALNGLRTLEVTTRERDLLLRYGSDLKPERHWLQASPAVDGLLRVRMDARWIDNMVEDLIQALQRVRRRRLLEEIEELCWVLEEALHGQEPEDGVLEGGGPAGLEPARAAACVWR